MAQKPIWALALSAVAAVLALYYFCDPAEFGFFPRCLFHSLTGLKCPACGMQRALHLALHGKFAASFLMCPLVYFVLAVYAAMVLCPKATGRLWFTVAVVAAFFAYSALRLLSLVP